MNVIQVYEHNMMAHIAELKNHGLHSKRDWSYDIPSQIMTKIENTLSSRSKYLHCLGQRPERTHKHRSTDFLAAKRRKHGKTMERG
jgi:hypothetical protein